MGKILRNARHNRGFTLIELVFAVGIVGILGALALPSYRDYLNNARASKVLLVYDAMREDVQILTQSSGLDPCNWQVNWSQGVFDRQTDFIRTKINSRIALELDRKVWNMTLSQFMMPDYAPGVATSAAAPLMVRFGGVGAANVATARRLAEDFKRIGKFNRWEREAKTYVSFSVFLGDCKPKA